MAEAMNQLNSALGMQGGGVEAPTRSTGRNAGGAQPPGTEDLSPEQMDQIERVSLMAQAAIADEQTGKQIIEEASRGPDGLFSAVSGVLKAVIDKMKLPREMIIPAGVTILIIIVKFLADIGKAQAGPQEIGKLIGGLAVVLGQEYGFADEEIAQMIGQMPTEGGMRGGAVTKKANTGALGSMMRRAQPEAAEEAAEPVDSVEEEEEER